SAPTLFPTAVVSPSLPFSPSPVSGRELGEHSPPLSGPHTQFSASQSVSKGTPGPAPCTICISVSEQRTGPKQTHSTQGTARPQAPQLNTLHRYTLGTAAECPSKRDPKSIG
ncbi:hypothetical protein KUCAC02_030696, partial [Chaenocephalus aceratus]